MKGVIFVIFEDFVTETWGAETFEDLTRELAAMTDRILRKHGKNIIGKQFATSRLADVMIDHWAGENHEFDLPRANHFAQDVESCGLTLEQFLNNQWSK